MPCSGVIYLCCWAIYFILAKFAYPGKIRDTVEELGAEQVQLLMNAADFYVVPGLKRLCEQWLVETLNTTNMVDRFSELLLVCLFLEFDHTG